jgi:hypothetical protein
LGNSHIFLAYHVRFYKLVEKGINSILVIYSRIDQENPRTSRFEEKGTGVRKRFWTTGDEPQ